MAIVVQSGTKQLPAASSSITIVRGTDSGFNTTVTKARTRLRVTYRTAGTSINPFTDYSLAATLTDGDTITVSRSGTADNVEVAWQLEEFEAGQLVAQYVTLTFTATTTATASISAASISGGRWIEYLGMVTAQENTQRSTVNLVFNSTTEVGGTRTSATGNVTVQAVVYEHVEATVQTVQQTLTTNTETDHDETITSVDTAKSFVTGTARCASSGGIADSSWQAHLTSSTNLRWSRQTGTSLTFTITCFVVTLADDTAVQRATVTHADGTGTVNTTITAVTLAETGVTFGAMMLPSLGRSAASAYGRALMTATLSSTTNLQTIKGIATTAATQYVQVIEWGAYAPPGPNPTSVGPSFGRTAGGTAVTITGTGFDASGGSSEGVTFDGVAATSVVFVGATSITCVTPAGSAGAVDVVVTNGDATTGTLVNGYTYTVGPDLTNPMGPTNGSGVLPTGSLTDDEPLSATAGAYLEIALVSSRGTLYTACLPEVP